MKLIADTFEKHFTPLEPHHNNRKPKIKEQDALSLLIHICLKIY